MTDEIVSNEILYWDQELSYDGEINNKIYEIAFFKIFVKFEVFLAQLFINYSVGKASFSGYIPERKLDFADEKHLEGILRSSKSSFIDYVEKIQSLSSHIFLKDKDPFSLVFSDSKYSSYYNNMKCIRNYIAHESIESRRKYHKNVIGETNKFTEPCNYLVKINKKNSKSYYTIYIETIKEICDILLEPRPYIRVEIQDTAESYAAATQDSLN